MTKFEEAYNIDIREYIEEIEVVTPFRLEKITNSVNGSMFGYSLKGYDNSINRLLAYKDEKIPNLEFVGAYSVFGPGIDNAFYSGYFVTEKLLNNKGD